MTNPSMTLVTLHPEKSALQAPSAVFEPGGFADHSTPLVMNCWYVAALSHEISRDIISRRLLGSDVALYRTLAGQAIAVRNRCPHRSFPLAKGRLDGDTLICGYHGMQFDPSGRCTLMPSMPITPGHAAVRSFALVEQAVFPSFSRPDCH